MNAPPNGQNFNLSLQQAQQWAQGLAGGPIMVSPKGILCYATSGNYEAIMKGNEPEEHDPRSLLRESQRRKDRAYIYDHSLARYGQAGVEKPNTYTAFRMSWDLLRYWGMYSPCVKVVEGLYITYAMPFAQPAEEHEDSIGWEIVHKDTGRRDFKPTEAEQQEYNKIADEIRDLFEHKTRTPYDRNFDALFGKNLQDALGFDRPAVSVTHGTNLLGKEAPTRIMAVDGTTIRPLASFLMEFVQNPDDKTIPPGMAPHGSDLLKRKIGAAWQSAANKLGMGEEELRKEADANNMAAWVQVPPLGAPWGYRYFKDDEIIVGGMNVSSNPMMAGYGESPRAKAIEFIRYYQAMFDYNIKRFSDGVPSNGIVGIVGDYDDENWHDFEQQIRARGSGQVSNRRLIVMKFTPAQMEASGGKPIFTESFVGNESEEKFREAMLDCYTGTFAIYDGMPQALSGFRAPTEGPQPLSEASSETVKKGTKTAFLQRRLTDMAAFYTQIVRLVDPRFIMRFKGLDPDRKAGKMQYLQQAARTMIKVNECRTEAGYEPLPKEDPRGEAILDPQLMAMMQELEGGSPFDAFTNYGAGGDEEPEEEENLSGPQEDREDVGSARTQDQDPDQHNEESAASTAGEAVSPGEGMGKSIDSSLAILLDKMD